jgi:ABC-type sugar transport system permease subunit
MNGQKDLADLLGRYADVVTAFAFGESIAFAAGMLANNGFRKAVYAGCFWAVAFSIVFYGFYFWFLYFSHKGIAELQLDEVILSPVAIQWTSRIWWFRVAIVGVSLGITLSGFLLPPNHDLLGDARTELQGKWR